MMEVIILFSCHRQVQDQDLPGQACWPAPAIMLPEQMFIPAHQQVILQTFRPGPTRFRQLRVRTRFVSILQTTIPPNPA